MWWWLCRCEETQASQTMITPSDTERFHAEYLRLTGLDIPFTTTQRFRLERFIFDGGNVKDLALVVAYLKRRIRDGKRQRESLLPRNLFVDYSNFAEDLSMARAEQRSQLSPRDTALKALGRPVEASKPARSVADILAGEEAFKDFIAMKQTL